MSPKVIEALAPGNLPSTRAPGVYQFEGFNLPGRVYFSTGVPIFLGTMRTAVSRAKTRTSAPSYIMLSLWSQFATQVGEPYEGCGLAHAVRGFFENGGHWCYVLVLKDRTDTTLASGLQDIADLHSVDLVCTPDLSDDKAQALGQQQIVIDHCEDLGTRFALLDSRLNDEPGDVWDQWSAIDGRNGALYYPWIQVSGFGSHSGELEMVPPCGHVAGVINRTDRAHGVHKAPANEVLNGVIGLERQLRSHDQDFLNPKGINCLRSFPGRGIRVWGARTLSGQPQWKYVNVRRLFLTAARWLDWNLLQMTFEPNDPQLWARIERKLTEFFAEQYRMGALKGDRLQAAFYVKCDADTNPPEARESSQVITEIGLAPAVPYEFVVVRLIRGARGANSSGNSTTHEAA